MEKGTIQHSCHLELIRENTDIELIRENIDTSDSKSVIPGPEATASPGNL